MMKILRSLLLLWTFLFTAQAIEIRDASPAVREHLNMVLQEMAKTETGKSVLQRIAPELVITARPLKELGRANAHNVITLESLRMDNAFLPETTERQKLIKLCHTAEILAHELMHNAQFRAGLMNFPARCSGVETVLLEKLLELQADLTGKKMYDELRNRPGYEDTVPAKPGLFLFMQRTSKEPEKEYIETLWSNRHITGSGRKLFAEQSREVAHWTQAYDLQAFRNHHRRFLTDVSGDPEAVMTHLQKIIRFSAMPVPAEFLLQKAPVQAVEHGISGWENGRKTRELLAEPAGIRVRRFSGSMMVQVKRIRLKQD